ncbi:MAG: hypothetical protein VXW65_15055 [Pseudomonadota bacterium]|nr:hypothetical protein [Pseudomonadota bacterium]
MPAKSMFDLVLEGKELDAAALTGTEMLVIERFNNDTSAQETNVITLNTLREWLHLCSPTSLHFPDFIFTDYLGTDFYISYEIKHGTNVYSDVWVGNYQELPLPTARTILMDFILVISEHLNDDIPFYLPSLENNFSLVGISQSEDWDVLRKTTLTLKIYDDGNSNPPDGGLDLVAMVFGESVSAHSCAVIYGGFGP